MSVQPHPEAIRQTGTKQQNIFDFDFIDLKIDGSSVLKRTGI
jgi:hypothetical protein